MRTLGRREFLTAAAAAAAWAAAPGATADARALTFGVPRRYDFEILSQRAEALAARAFEPPREIAPEILGLLDFDAVQKVQFRPRFTLWADAGSAYPVRFFHPHAYQKLPVRAHEVTGGQAREILFTPQAFDYGGTGFDQRLSSARLGWAGFRFMAPDQKTDWLAFQGASYFRTAGVLDQYGLSARGLAIDTGLTTPEEFPRFTEFWLHRPEAGAATVLIDALLDGPSIAGAFRFQCSRGSAVLMEVRSRLFCRRDIKRLGVAPLTSMYWYSESDRRSGDDWRPEVHDSDGLALWTGAGERIWRPLNNPSWVRTNTFLDRDPKGYGLLQRDRAFENYQDDGAFYDRRPSLWVEPLGGWGEGGVQLVELPTDDEIHDNVVAYWRPAAPVSAGSRWNFDYRLHWLADEPYPHDRVGRVVATRAGRGGIPGQPRPVGVFKFVVDFEGGTLPTLEQRFDVATMVGASRGKVGDAYALKVVGTARWRAAFDLTVDGTEAVDLRCYLRLGDEVLTETWLHQYLPTPT
jgi:glucans biosynthesis protein